MILAGAGVGGGSLNYANTLYVPPDAVLQRPAVVAHHRLARGADAALRAGQRMLGVVDEPDLHRRRPHHQRGRRRHGRAATPSCRPRSGCSSDPTAPRRPARRCPTRTSAAPGPARTGCLECGSCMTGCRYGAKNTLLKNYLGLAESAGAQIHPMTTVTRFEQRPDGLWEVRTERTGRVLRRKQRTFTANARGAGRRHVRHPEAAVQDARHGHAARSLGSAGRADPHQLRVDRRRRRR